MKKLLFVDCCISQRGDASRTRALCRAFLDAYAAAHPADAIETLPLREMTLAPFTADMLNRRDCALREGRLDEPLLTLARQFAAADFIVVGAPFWDLSFPAQLKIYMEYISANGVTFYYDETGAHGACRAEKLLYLTAGGDRAADPSLGILQWEKLAPVFGIGQFDSLFADRLDLDPAQAPALLAAACKQAAALAKIW